MGNLKPKFVYWIGPQALNFLAHLTSRGGIVLFVVRQPHLVHAVEAAAKECGEFAHCRPWDSNVFLSPNVVFGGEVRLPDAVVFLHTKEVRGRDSAHTRVGLFFHVIQQFCNIPNISDAYFSEITTITIVPQDINNVELWKCQPDYGNVVKC